MIRLYFHIEAIQTFCIILFTLSTSALLTSTSSKTQRTRHSIKQGNQNSIIISSKTVSFTRVTNTCTQESQAIETTTPLSETHSTFPRALVTINRKRKRTKIYHKTTCTPPATCPRVFTPNIHSARR